MASMAKGLSDEMPPPSELRKGAYRSKGKEEDDEGGEDEMVGLAEEAVAAASDGDAESFLAAIKAIVKRC